jgi:hypothetical protein
MIETRHAEITMHAVARLPNLHAVLSLSTSRQPWQNRTCDQVQAAKDAPIGETASINPRGTDYSSFCFSGQSSLREMRALQSAPNSIARVATQAA